MKQLVHGVGGIRLVASALAAAAPHPVQLCFDWDGELPLVATPTQ